MQPSILHSVTQVRSKISYLFLRFIFHDVASTLGLKSQEIGCSSSAFTTFSSHTDDHPFPLLSCVQWGRVTLVVIPVLENWRSRVATAALLDPPPPSCVAARLVPPSLFAACTQGFLLLRWNKASHSLNEAAAAYFSGSTATSKLTSEALCTVIGLFGRKTASTKKPSKFFTCPIFSDFFSVSP